MEPHPTDILRSKFDVDVATWIPWETPTLP